MLHTRPERGSHKLTCTKDGGGFGSSGFQIIFYVTWKLEGLMWKLDVFRTGKSGTTKLILPPGTGRRAAAAFCLRLPHSHVSGLHSLSLFSLTRLWGSRPLAPAARVFLCGLPPPAQPRSSQPGGSNGHDPRPACPQPLHGSPALHQRLAGVRGNLECAHGQCGAVGDHAAPATWPRSPTLTAALLVSDPVLWMRGA